MDINHISVSRKKTFDQCQQQYKYRYHLKLASPDAEPFYFVYGKIVHKIAELYVINNGEIPIGDLCKDVLRGKIPIEENKFCPPIPDDYQKKLQKHLRAIQNLTSKIGCDGLVEYKFHYDLDPPNGKHATGFIDRLILKGKTFDENGEIVKAEKAFIIDYKTTKKGKFRVNADTIKEDLQLRMYARVVQRNFGVSPSNIKAALFYLEGENLIAAQYSEKDLLETEDLLRQGFFRIEQSDPDKVWGSVGWHCKNCSYASICPFYKGGNAQSQPEWCGSLEALGHTPDPWS